MVFYTVTLMFVTDLYVIVSSAINFGLIYTGITRFKADCQVIVEPGRLMVGHTP